MAQRRCTGHHPCRPHSLSHHVHQKNAVHVRQRELAARILSLLHSVPGYANTAVAADSLSNLIPVQQREHKEAHQKLLAS